MTHNNRDIAQEGAEVFLSNELWEYVDQAHDMYGWNEMFIVKISKRDAMARLVRSSVSAFKVEPGVLEQIREIIGVMGSFCLKVKRNTKEIKHVWNLPFERRGNVVIPDGCASSLILDSVAKLNEGKTHLTPEKYASLGKGV